MEAKPKFKKFTSRRNKPKLIVDELYLFNLNYQYKKNKVELYRCQKFKTSLLCKAYLKIQNNEIIEYNNNHNHLSNDLNIIKEITKKDLKNQLNNASDPFTLKIPKLYKSYSTDKGIRIPSYNTVKTTLYKEIRKFLPEEIKSLNEAPENPPYYNTIDNENYLIYKDDKTLIFQSVNLAKIQLKFGTIVFCDATFYIC